MRWLTYIICGVAVVVLGVAIVVVVNLSESGQRADQAPGETPGETLPPNTTAQAGPGEIVPLEVVDKTPPAAGEVDLLDGLDLSRQTLQGDWALSSAGLTARGGTPQAPARMQFPCDLPEEYDCTVMFKSRGARASVTLVFAAGDRQFVWTVNGQSSGFGLLNGAPALQNRTSSPYSIKQDETYTAVVQVRNRGVAAIINGEQLNALATDYSDLTLSDRWSLQAGYVLGLACMGELDFQELKISPAVEALADASSSSSSGEQLAGNDQQGGARRGRGGRQGTARGGRRGRRGGRNAAGRGPGGDRGSRTDTDPTRPGEPDYALWTATQTLPHYYNRKLIRPDWPQSLHADVLQRASSSGDSARVSLARLTMAKDVLVEELVKLNTTDNELRSSLPSAVFLSQANAVLRELMGEQRTFFDLRGLAESDPPGGLLQLVDNVRGNMIQANLLNIFLNFTNVAMAEKLESDLRAALADKPDLTADALLFLDKTPDEIFDDYQDRSYGGAQSWVRVSYAGKTPLTHVLVITRLDMKPLDEHDKETRDFVHGVNEIFGAGEQRVNAADLYVATTQALNATPHATLAYFPVLNSGDVAYVPLHGLEEFWGIAEARVSFYCDQGMLRDKVMMRGGPHNDLSLSSDERRRQTPREPEPKLAYPLIPSWQKVEVTLRDSADNGPFEYDVCIPAGTTYLPTGAKVTAGALGVTEVVAADVSTYICVGPERDGGRCLIMVPKAQTTDRKVTDFRNEEDKRREQR